MRADSPRTVTRLRSAVLYTAFVIVPVAVLVAIIRAMPDGAVGTGAGRAPTQSASIPLPKLSLLLAQLAIILVACRMAGAALRRLGQPQVVGEMLAGLLLGPSLLGWALPAQSAALFPGESLGFLSALAQTGLVIFMFLVGLELDPAAIRERAGAALVTSHASIGVPLLLGVLVAIPMFPALVPEGVAFTPFALFLGAAMSVTAFPVLARILQERNMQGTRLGAMAIACAAVDDVTAWILLAVVVVIARSTGGASLLPIVAGSVLYVTLMLTVGRRLLARVGDHVRATGRVSADMLALIVIAVLASAWTTETLGIHALFGAFLVGVIAPKDAAFVNGVRVRFEDVMVVVLLPIFFAFTGLRVRIDLLAGTSTFLLTLAVLAAAIIGKLGGSTLAARASGLPLGEAAALGVLMNTRGLMELVILNVGLDIGVISPVVYSMMVLMALVTTAMTTPLLDLTMRRSPASARAMAAAH